MTENTKIYLLKQKILNDISDAEIPISVSVMLLKELYIELKEMADSAIEAELSALEAESNESPQGLKGEDNG